MWSGNWHCQIVSVFIGLLVIMVVNLIKHIDQLKSIKSKLVGGDIFMGIDNALDLLEEKYKKKKTDRRIFLITNG